MKYMTNVVFGSHDYHALLNKGFVQKAPKATDVMTVAELKEAGMVGIYNPREYCEEDDALVAAEDAARKAAFEDAKKKFGINNA